MKKGIAGISFIALSILLFACNNNPQPESPKTYTPDSKELYDSIVHMDSVLFGAYNICDLETMAGCTSGPPPRRCP